MGKRTKLVQPLPPATPEDQTKAKRLMLLLETAATIPTYDSDPKLWDEVLTILNLDLCYQVTIAEVLQRGTWRKAANPPAYIASAAVRSAQRKKLPDYFEKEFRRVASDEPNSDVGTRLDSGAGFDLEEWGGGGIYERTASGALRYVDDDYDFDRQIPEWLQRGNEYDAIDWETVAAHAVLKPRMACQLARVLIDRLERRLGRPEAMSRAANADEASAIEASWKWIDRNIKERIAPLFQMAAPPRSLATEDIVSFPLLAAGVSLRVDLHLQWDGSRLLMARTGLTPDGDGTFPAFFVEADSQAAAMGTLRAAAAEGDEDEDSDIFHFWPVESGPTTAKMPESSKQGAFVKPWEALSRARGNVPKSSVPRDVYK